MRNLTIVCCVLAGLSASTAIAQSVSPAQALTDRNRCYSAARDMWGPGGRQRNCQTMHGTTDSRRACTARADQLLQQAMTRCDEAYARVRRR